MSAQHPHIDDPELGRLARAESALDDGTTVVHDWYAGRIPLGDGELELMIDGTDIDAVSALLPRIREMVADVDTVRRRASDAVVTRFSDGDPTRPELDDASADLVLEALEATADGDIVLHFVDTCGQHFPHGYWPAVHVDAAGEIIDVTVEA